MKRRTDHGDKGFIRGGKQHYAGTIDNVFNKGVERNIASFHRNITEGHFENPLKREMEKIKGFTV